ncbi:MAG: hypothetical protein ABI220_03570 [Candidatus Saccharimonadales bacterium]
MATIPKIQHNLIQVGRALNLFRLGNNLAGVFIPLVILKSGGALWEIALFYLVYALVKLCVNYSFMKIIQRRGAHFGLGAGFIFSALQLAAILSYSHYQNIIILILAGILLAFTNAFVWNAQHYYISSNMDPLTKSSSIAAIEIYGRIFDIVSPILGGLIGAKFGAAWLLLASLVCVMSAFVPLRRLKEDFVYQPSEKLRYNLKGAPIRDLIANYCFNIETIVGSLAWPIYLAIVIGSYKSIGLITALAAMAAIATTWVAGYQGDSGKDRTVLRQGIAASSVIDLLRLAATSLLSITVVGAVYRAALAYFQNSWTSIYYGHARNKGAQYIISMEIACDLAYATFWSILLVLTLTSSNTHLIFNIVFVIAAIAAWGCLAITRQRQLIKE